MYITIINTEMMLWMRYKMDPFRMFGDISLNDLLFYTETLTNRLKDEMQDRTQDRLMKCLVQIRDTLNYMTFTQVANN